jgi:hypothetical protein
VLKAVSDEINVIRALSTTLLVGRPANNFTGLCGTSADFLGLPFPITKGGEGVG